MMDTLLILNIPTELEEDLVDYLLELDCVNGFTSLPVRGHGRHGLGLSLAEQVSGRRQRLRVEILLHAGDVDTVLAGMATAVGRDITWWTQPVTRNGRIA